MLQLKNTNSDQITSQVNLPQQILFIISSANVFFIVYL